MDAMRGTQGTHQTAVEDTRGVESCRDGACQTVVRKVNDPCLREDMTGIWQGATAQTQHG